MQSELIALVDAHGTSCGWEFTHIKMYTARGIDRMKANFADGRYRVDWMQSKPLFTTNLDRLGMHVDYIYLHPSCSTYASKYTLEAFKVVDGKPHLLYVPVHVPSEPVVVRAFTPGQVVLAVSLQPVTAFDPRVSIELSNPLSGTTTLLVHRPSRDRLTIGTLKSIVNNLLAPWQHY